MIRTLMSLLVITSLTLGGCSGGEEEPQPKTPKIESSEAKNEVVITTNKGIIRVEVYPDRSPESVKNFLGYIESGFYEGLVFHRVIPGFMIQGGGHTADLQEKESKTPIKNEATNGLSNLRGTISMARTEVIDSATSQFFINLVDNTRLDHQNTNKYGYAVFGKVVTGMDIVDLIGNTTTVCPSKFLES